MADDQKDVILNILLKIGDNKLPPIDTKAAEAAIDAYKTKVQTAQREVAASVSSMAQSATAGAGAGGAAGGPAIGGAAPYAFSFQPGGRSYYGPPGQGTPAYTIPPGGVFADFNQFPGGVGPMPRPYGPYGAGARPIYGEGAATLLSGPWNGSDYWGGVRGGSPAPRGWSYGGWANGPVSDPGSWGQSSLQTGRGYDQAMLRRRVESRDAYSDGWEDDARGGYRKVLQGTAQAGHGIMQLAAGIVLLNKAAEEGADAWQNFHTRLIGTISLISGGTTTALGVGATSIGAGRLALGGTKFLAGQAAFMGATGTASFLGAGTMGVGEAIAGGGLAGATAIGAIGLGTLGVGALAYGGYQFYRANQANQSAMQRGEQLDNQLEQFQRYRNWQRARPIRELGYDLESSSLRSQAGLSAVEGGGMSAAEFARVGAGEIDRIRQQQEIARHALGGLTASGQTQDVGRYYDAQRDAAREIFNWQSRINQAKREELQIAQRNLQAARDQADQQRKRSEDVRNDIGRINPGDFARFQRLGTAAERLGGLTPRLANYIEGIVGYREGGDASDFLNRQGQERIDSNQRLRQYLGNDVRTSGGMKELEAKLKQYEIDMANGMKAIGDTVERTGQAFAAQAEEIDAINRREEVRTGRTMQRVNPKP